jgi:hypothetical protein
MAIIKPRLPRKSLWLVSLSLGAVLSGCSFLPLKQRPVASAPPPAPSAALLRQAAAHGFAAGFTAGRRFQESHDRELALAGPSVPAPLVVVPASTAPAAPVAPGTLPTITMPATATVAPAPAAPASHAQPAQTAPAPKPLPASIPVQAPAGSNFVPRGAASPISAAPDPF